MQAQKRPPIKTEKAPHMEKEVVEKPPVGEKGPPPHKEKNVAKRPTHEEIVAERPLPYISNKGIFNFSEGGGAPTQSSMQAPMWVTIVRMAQ